MKQTYCKKKVGIFAYTEHCGPAGLAGSIHFAVKYANQVVRKAGDGIGILYAVVAERTLKRRKTYEKTGI